MLVLTYGVFFLYERECPVSCLRYCAAQKSACEAAAVLRIPKSRVYELTQTDSFPAIRIGNRMDIPRDKLIQWINAQSEVSD